MFEAVKVALDPSPAQERLFQPHAGGARFAYNAGLAHVKAALDAGEKPEWTYLLAAALVEREQRQSCRRRGWGTLVEEKLERILRSCP